MRAIHDILTRARDHGVKVRAVGDRLRLKARHKPPEELLAEMRQHKPEIIAMLTEHCVVCCDPLDAGEIIDATDGYSHARIHRRCLDAWIEATAPAWAERTGLAP